MTEDSLGACFVLKQKKLSGIISERDLRIAIEHHTTSVFNLSAKDMMNPKPSIVEAHQLAKEALTNGNLLNFAPVFSKKKLVGLLRLRDLIEALR